MTKAIQLFCATYDVDACMKEIRECLEIGWTGMGFKTVQFEDAWKKYTGFEDAVYLNSSTAGLNLAIEILKDKYNWADGDEIITTPFTFISTNHAILHANMKPVFADIDETLCLDPNDVERKITDKTRAVMFVGFGGNTGQYPAIVDLCKRHNLKLILDAAHMAGTRLNGEIPGKEAYITVYSFQAVKNLPTGDSGMLCCNDHELAEDARKRAWLGINKDTYARSVDEDGVYKWRYDVEYTGYKYNGNAVMASIGLAQLPHLDEGNKRRREMAAIYDGFFKDYPEQIKTIPIADDCETSRHLYQIVVNDRDGLMRYLNEHEIYPGVHYVTNTEYRMYSYADGTCPKSDEMTEHVISLPLHLRLTDDDVKRVAECVIEYVTA